MPRVAASKGQLATKMAPKTPKLKPPRKPDMRLKNFLGGMLMLYLAFSVLDIGLSNIIPALALYAPSRQVESATNGFTHQQHGRIIHSCFPADGTCEPADDYNKYLRTVDPPLTQTTPALHKAMFRKALLLKQYSIVLADNIYEKVKATSNTRKACTVNPPKAKVKVKEPIASLLSWLKKAKAIFEKLLDMTKSELICMYSKLATPFVLTSLETVLLTVNVIRYLVEFTLGLSTGILFLGRAFRDPAAQLPPQSRVRRTYEKKLARIDKDTLIIIPLMWLAKYLAERVSNHNSPFTPVFHYWFMVPVAGLALNNTPFAALSRDIISFSTVCANTFRYLRAFRTDREAHVQFAELAVTWADQTTWRIVTGFCEGLIDPKAAFLFPLVYMGFVKGRWPDKDYLTSNADNKGKASATTESLAEPADKTTKKPVSRHATTAELKDIFSGDYKYSRPHDQVCEAELPVWTVVDLLTEERLADCAREVRETLAGSESDQNEWDKVSN